jgi:hypothetical protein
VWVLVLSRVMCLQVKAHILLLIAHCCSLTCMWMCCTERQADCASRPWPMLCSAGLAGFVNYYVCNWPLP